VIDFENIAKKVVDSLVEFDKEHRENELPSNEPDETQQQRIENVILQSTKINLTLLLLTIQVMVKQKTHLIFQKAIQLAKFPNWKMKFKN
jgi:hypothetical protein